MPINQWLVTLTIIVPLAVAMYLDFLFNKSRRRRKDFLKLLLIWFPINFVFLISIVSYYLYITDNLDQIFWGIGVVCFRVSEVILLSISTKYFYAWENKGGQNESCKNQPYYLHCLMTAIGREATTT